MDSALLIAAGASFIAGLIGYIITRLWIRPIVGYRITRRKFDHELSRYMERMQASGGPATPAHQQHGETALRMARKHAMDLIASYGTEIPYWYRLWLDSRNESPAEASGLLTNLSKLQDRKLVKSRIVQARKKLGLS
jgi:hypothetical protein